MKLTLPAVEQGLRSILVDGVKVGHVVAVWSDFDPWRGAWEATLYSAPGCVDVPNGRVCCLRLRHLRDELRARLEEKGPWWSA
jgi:hypothetical protein